MLSERVASKPHLVMRVLALWAFGYVAIRVASVRLNLQSAIALAGARNCSFLLFLHLKSVRQGGTMFNSHR